MATVTFGSTIRAHDALALQNTGTSNIYVPFLRSVIYPGATRYLTFTELDQAFRAWNLRESDLYTVNGDGSKFQDDMSVLAKLISSSDLLCYVCSTSGTYPNLSFTLGATAAYTSTGDGSVSFS